jgi:hypothetical protein
MSDIVRILVAPLVWLASFSAVYGLHGIACAYGWGGIEVAGLTLLRSALTAAWLGAVAVQTVILAGLYSERFGSPSRFVRHVSGITGWVGLVATVWTLFPAATTSSCG